MCRFCGQGTDQYWSRCFRIFVTTEKGRKILANWSRRSSTRPNATNAVVACSGPSRERSEVVVID